MFKIFLILAVAIPVLDASFCGCKSMRRCYIDMLNTLRDKDEEACVEQVAPGMNTLMIYLKALKQFCPELVTVVEKNKTYEGRPLYRVIMNQVNNISKIDQENKPVIIIESGQRSGADTTNLALVLMQQLVACNEYNDLTIRAKWVILPSVNPDGLEYSVYNRIDWKKNLRPTDSVAIGIDLAKNFGFQWGACEKISSVFSAYYPGPAPFSENETMFIRDVLLRYKDNAKAYVSIRSSGHSLLTPFSYTYVRIDPETRIKKYAYEITNRVNQRAGVIQTFVNESIFTMNGAPRCGSSVDYAYNIGIPYTYELRVFFGRTTGILAQFQALPRGYYTQLLMGYLSGIKKLYDLVVSEKHPPKKPAVF